MLFITKYKGFKIATISLGLSTVASLASGFICFLGFCNNVSKNVSYYSFKTNTQSDSLDVSSLSQPMNINLNNENIGGVSTSVESINGSQWELKLYNPTVLSELIPTTTNDLIKVDVNLSIGWSNAVKANNVNLKSQHISPKNSIADNLKNYINVKCSNSTYRNLKEYVSNLNNGLDTTKNKIVERIDYISNNEKQIKSLYNNIKQGENGQELIDTSLDNSSILKQYLSYYLTTIEGQLNLVSEVNSIQTLFIISILLLLFSSILLLATVITFALQIKAKKEDERKIQEEQFDIEMFL